MRKQRLALAGILAVLTMTGIAHANLLTNGDFESSATLTDTNGVPTGFYTSESWTHWSWSTGWSELTAKATATGGNDSVLLNVGNNWYDGGGGAYQTVAATAGEEYRLTVDSGADAWWQPTGEMAMIWLDSTNGIISSVTRYTVDPAVYGTDVYDTLMPMENYSLTGVAPEGTTAVKVEFASRMPGGVGGTVTFDNAVLDVIPEPSTIGLTGLAGGALLLFRRRLKK
ncbi:MAG: PEP-CTERM sorting domain-containing protein [Pontiellaceae bacterium]|nr:PEP-CTERM sorting domain-containing protein [Pontiellaceae bacterium]MBN2785989.1 PEP-CTERM sorting domain-containing protein [Pontiellaceae bacterium]